MTEGNKLTKEEKFEKAIEWLENADFNCDNIQRLGYGVIPLIKSQIRNAIKFLRDEEVDENVWGGDK